MKFKFLLFNSLFLVKAKVNTEYEGYYKGIKIDTECCKNNTLDEVKRLFSKENNEIRILYEKNEKRIVNEDGKDKEVDVKFIKFEILEKSSIKFIENEFFKDNLSKYLIENIKFNISYNSIIEILKNYKDENNISKPIEFGKDSNGIVEIKIYNDDELITIDDKNKDNVLNFTRIHFIFTQDLYKICPIKISIKTLDSYKNKDREYGKNRYNEFVCEENGLTLRKLFDNIAIGKASQYNEENHNIEEKNNKYFKRDKNEHILYNFFDSIFNINSINVFKTIKKIKFKYRNSDKIETIYDETVGNNIEKIFDEKFKYSYLGEYIIETDFSDDNRFHISVTLKSNNLISHLNFSFNKTITVGQFKKFLKVCNIIKDKDALKITKTEKRLFGFKDIELKDSENIGDSKKYIFYNCDIKIANIDEFKERKFLNNLKLGDYLEFYKDKTMNRCNSGSNKPKR